MQISVRQFLDIARTQYTGNLKVLCALGAAMAFATRLGVTGIGEINISGMPLQSSGAAFLRLLNPRLTVEQSGRWYNQIVCRNDCQERRSRAWSTLKKAVLMGEHYRFVRIGKGYSPEFIVPNFMPAATEVSLLETVDFQVTCEHAELLVATA